MHLARATGWWPWIPQDARDISHTPYAHRLVEIAREEWNGSQIVDPRSLDPMMNVVDLWWCPVEPAFTATLPDAASVYDAWGLRTEGRDDTAMIARLAYEAYLATLVLSMPQGWDALPTLMAWEDLDALHQAAWCSVVRTVRLCGTGQTP